jgi:hypothetical protein
VITATDQKAAVVAYIEAVGRKDWDTVAPVLHPDVEFRLTGQSWDKDGYLAALRRLGNIVDHN